MAERLHLPDLRRTLATVGKQLKTNHSLTHCYHHEPGAMLAQMMILLLGFVLFTAFVMLHCQPLRLGQMSREALVEEMKTALAEDLPWAQWFASG